MDARARIRKARARPRDGNPENWMQIDIKRTKAGPRTSTKPLQHKQLALKRGRTREGSPGEPQSIKAAQEKWPAEVVLTFNEMVGPFYPKSQKPKTCVLKD